MSTPRGASAPDLTAESQSAPARTSPDSAGSSNVAVAEAHEAVDCGGVDRDWVDCPERRGEEEAEDELLGGPAAADPCGGVRRVGLCLADTLDRRGVGTPEGPGPVDARVGGA
eukprot:CAMPEP_0171195426 /NCGR_PEP_ID=MMETSP0790-20130122/21391_1 /TAXON_ID=2925 /ORGANISM="Alexandrium catenella, Strain OF101" /LENGTH=112 /DNA_ID=CAMNT_0011660639 /DNA_START=13 /DNA_END=348 /DNA_ORIENTATION=-